MRFLFYSHDSYGLGHIRRTTVIAERLLRKFPAPSALVVTGSLLSVVPLIAAFLLLQRYWQSGLTAGGVKE